MPHVKETFFDKTAITTASVDSDVIDTGAADAGRAERQEILISVPEAFVLVSGAPTLQFQLKDCATEGGSYVAQLMTKAYVTAELAKTKELIRFGLPSPLKRYLKLSAVLAVSTFSAGKVSARLVNRMY